MLATPERGAAQAVDTAAARRLALTNPTGAFDRVGRSQTLGDMLRRSARRTPDKTALIFDDEQWTYAQLDQHATRLAAALSARGLVAGDRIAVLSRNSHHFVALRYAVARLGAVFVPINFMLNVDDVRYILEHSAPEALFVDSSTAETGLAAADRARIRHRVMMPGGSGDGGAGGVCSFDDLLAGVGDVVPGVAIDGRSIAQIIYTSGTESRPKGAMISHDAVLWQVQSCIADCGWEPGSVQLNAMPLFHCAQLDAFLAPSLQVGGTNIIIPSAAPDIVIPMIARHRVTAFFAPPTVWISLLRSPLLDAHDLTSLACGYYGASIMPVEVLKEMQERLPGLDLWNCYGQTEITCIATTLQPEDQLRKAGSAGKPVLHVETRVVDDDMRDVLPGETGEVVHRSPQLLTGYWRDPEKTAEAFTGGWFHSGDLATIDEEGFITIVDRKKDMIKSGGENVSSREVEEVLYQLSAVSEAAVIGVPDPRWIEMVTAFVVVKPGAALSERDIIDHCNTRLSRFKAPKRVMLVPALPRNASGKILKRDLRDALANGNSPQQSARP